MSEVFFAHRALPVGLLASMDLTADLLDFAGDPDPIPLI